MNAHSQQPTHTTGVVYRPDYDPDTLRGFAQAADAGGIDELWLWEDCFLQGAIAQAAVALASTQKVVVGIGVMPAPLRSVAATALELATLSRMFPGRLRVGVGHGVQSWMRQAGVAVDSPLTLLREYVQALQRLLAGEKVTVSGRYVRLADVQLEWTPALPVPVLIGATGPKTLRLAGEIADGVILDCQHTARTVRDALTHVAAGRDTHRPFTTVMYLACVLGSDSATRLSTEAQKWRVPSADGFGVGGSADEIRTGAAAYRAAGVDTVVFQPLGGPAEAADLISAAGAGRHP